MISLNTEHLKGVVEQDDLEKIWPKVRQAHDNLQGRKGKGAEFTGWLDLPSRIPAGLLKELKQLSAKAAKNSDCLVSVGIGGSYLGIRASLEFLEESVKLPVYYAGNNMSSDYLHNLLKKLKTKRITLVVISKSGTTTEPALAFRLIRKLMQEKYTAKELKDRIICVTDEKKGALRKIADQGSFRSYVIPDDVGGRYSILTPVGLVPLALAGIDVQSLVKGARQAQSDFQNCDMANACYRYAACRNVLYRKGKKIEVYSSFYPNVFYVTEWLKQLFGESEGKDHKGIFPASLTLSADLHSMGQLMQEGERTLFETFIQITKPNHKVIIPSDKQNLDGFNYVAGKDLDFVNKKAYEATAAAHYEGGVPNMALTLPKADAFNLGYLYYFFEKACGISGYVLGVNPFDQPGVEAYKAKMFALLK